MLKTSIMFFFNELTVIAVIAKETIKILFMYKMHKLILNKNIASHSKNVWISWFKDQRPCEKEKKNPISAETVEKSVKSLKQF